MVEKNAAVTQYFDALVKALAGLDMYLREDDSPLYKHDVIGSVVAGYLERMDESLESWENRISFTDHFRISRSESGFPVFQNVLELENDRRVLKSVWRRCQMTRVSARRWSNIF